MNESPDADILRTRRIDTAEREERSDVTLLPDALEPPWLVTQRWPLMSRVFGVRPPGQTGY